MPHKKESPGKRKPSKSTAKKSTAKKASAKKPAKTAAIRARKPKSVKRGTV